jgi:hypothetical protein
MFAANAMTIQDWVMLLTAIGTLVGVVTSSIAAFLAQLAKIKGDENSERLQTLAVRHEATDLNVQKIELATNSMKDALVKATGDAAFAQGKAEGKAEQKIILPKGNS